MTFRPSQWTAPIELAERVMPGLRTPGPPDGDATPEWWRDRLLARIEEKRAGIELLDDYYEGRHRLWYATSRYREAFGRLLRPLRDDWLQLVVQAAVERLVVDGFRFGATDESGDEAAWTIWQDNGLDARSQIAHTEAIKLGSAYLVVGPDEYRMSPRILIEHPLRAITEEDPVVPGKRLAGLQRWVDHLDVEHVVLWLPETRVEWRKTREGWVLVDEIDNEVEAVPIVGLVNRPSLRDASGISDLTSCLPLQDAVNKLVADMVIASEYAAFRQRWATGVEIPVDPETGEPAGEQWVSAVSRVWTVGDPEASFGEFGATDLGNYQTAVEMLVRHIAAQTRTPPHYLLGQVVNASAEALKAAEAGLVARVRAKQQTMGESWEEAMRLAFAWVGDTERAATRSCEVMWRDPETRTEAERVDAAVKLASIGVPREALWARLPDVTPQMIARWREMAAREAPLTPPETGSSSE